MTAGHPAMVAVRRHWQVRDSTPGVWFRRTRLTGALPVPVAGGDLGELWQMLNITEADRPLVLAWAGRRADPAEHPASGADAVR